jgi:flotillin
MAIVTKQVEGWRGSRPLEDPEKTKRWGFVSARPSEFLVHVRRGRILDRSSGQGASCFKWPWDSVAIVPTSLQRLTFDADQVTLEKVGIAVRGLAVYRITDPVLAYRVLNFSYPERAQQKLAETLTAMCVGATRRIVAGLSLDACLTRRKAEIAQSLLEEIAPVVGGRGRPDDPTRQGWGVVLDTLEIQEVRVSSDAVFAAMQAPYRAHLDREAREARAEADAATALREAESHREAESARLDAAAEVRAREAAIREDEARQRLEREAALRARERDIESAEAEAATAEAIRRQALAVQAAEAEIAAHEVEVQRLSLSAERDALAWRADHARREAEAAVTSLEGRQHAEVKLADATAEQALAAADARRTVAERLPDLAAAVGERMGEVRLTQIGGDGFGSITKAVSSLLELARDA